MIYQPDENRYHTMEYRRCCGRSGVLTPPFRWGYMAQLRRCDTGRK